MSLTSTWMLRVPVSVQLAVGDDVRDHGEAGEVGGGGEPDLAVDHRGGALGGVDRGVVDGQLVLVDVGVVVEHVVVRGRGVALDARGVVDRHGRVVDALEVDGHVAGVGGPVAVLDRVVEAGHAVAAQVGGRGERDRPRRRARPCRPWRSRRRSRSACRRRRRRCRCRAGRPRRSRRRCPRCPSAVSSTATGASLTQVMSTVTWPVSVRRAVGELVVEAAGAVAAQVRGRGEGDDALVEVDAAAGRVGDVRDRQGVGLVDVGVVVQEAAGDVGRRVLDDRRGVVAGDRVVVDALEVDGDTCPVAVPPSASSTV